jgi:hypothetical protein
VTQLRKRVLEELERRNYSQTTAHAYVAAIRRFAEHFQRSPDRLGREHIRQYQLYLIEDRKLRPKSVMVQMAALRFLYLKVLRRSYSRDDLPLPKQQRRQVPVVLSPDEVARLINAAPNLRYRTILMTLYSTGMRRAELCRLRPEDIDKECMILRIPHGKGDKAREVPDFSYGPPLAPRRWKFLVGVLPYEEKLALVVLRGGFGDDYSRECMLDRGRDAGGPSAQLQDDPTVDTGGAGCRSRRRLGNLEAAGAGTAPLIFGLRAGYVDRGWRDHPRDLPRSFIGTALRPSGGVLGGLGGRHVVGAGGAAGGVAIATWGGSGTGTGGQ